MRMRANTSAFVPCVNTRLKMRLHGVPSVCIHMYNCIHVYAFVLSANMLPSVQIRMHGVEYVCIHTCIRVYVCVCMLNTYA